MHKLLYKICIFYFRIWHLAVILWNININLHFAMPYCAMHYAKHELSCKYYNTMCIISSFWLISYNNIELLIWVSYKKGMDSYYLYKSNAWHKDTFFTVKWSMFPCVNFHFYSFDRKHLSTWLKMPTLRLQLNNIIFSYWWIRKVYICFKNPYTSSQNF